jgi:hypothetical protein
MTKKNSVKDGVPPKDRLTSSFKKLAISSTHLQAASDELGKTVSVLDAALSNLNLGVSAWYQIAANEDQSGNYWSRDIGYAKVNKTWGIALRRTWGNENYDDHNEEVWLFEDAPRFMCIESVGKLPHLLEELIERTEETTKKIIAKTAEAKELAEALSIVTTEAAGRPNTEKKS